MTQTLSNLTVAILVENGFEEVEMTQPREALQTAGATTVLVSPSAPHVQAMNHDDKGARFQVDSALDDVQATSFDALLIPGGVRSPDALRMNPTAVSFVREFAESGKPLAVICHGPWMLVESGLAKGRTLTSWPSLKTDIQNAGGTWVDREVVTDNGIVTSRKPSDIPQFNEAMLALFAGARRSRAETGTLEATDRAKR